MTAGLAMLASTALQNACFTLVSRARNSRSLGYHAIASVLSNAVWLLVLRQVVQHLDSLPLMAAYVAGSVLGGVASHYVSLRWIERGDRRAS